MKPTLVVEDIRTTFPADGSGRIPIVDEVSFQIARGEVLAIVGESGCGKSMTAMSIMRLVPRPGRVESGRVLLEGHEILSLSVPEMRSVRGSGISMIFQEPMTSLNPVISCGKQVVEAIRLHEALSKQAAKERTIQLFGDVGIPDPAARFGSDRPRPSPRPAPSSAPGDWRCRGSGPRSEPSPPSRCRRSRRPGRC